MGFLGRLFGKTPPPPSPPEHAVLLCLKLSDENFGSTEEREAIHALSDELESAINEAAAGEFDGDEFGGGECTLYMYGPDADALFQAIEPVLKRSAQAEGATLTRRYGAAGDSDAREEVTTL